MAYKPVQRLDVSRTLSNGESVKVGVLAQNRQAVFFQYDADYLQDFGNLSPFKLKATTELQQAPKEPHNGLHGVFGDALPDGWGLLLQDRVFRQQGILPNQVTAMDRLAFVGQSAMGALTFSPSLECASQSQNELEIAELGLQAQLLFDGQTDEVLAALVAAGSSGGARPKVQVYFSKEGSKVCRTQAVEGDDAWLVKFTSNSLHLGHEEGLCEAAYLTMAKSASLNPPEWHLLDAPSQSGASYWLALKRFDYLNHGHGLSGRKHMHSACGLLDADFRIPSLDYEDLIKASQMLCKSPAVGQLQFKRAMFNLFACNHDDHSKNWAFLQDDQGVWQPAPFYDVTFSPYGLSEHATSFAGFGKSPPVKAVQSLATAASFANWQQAQQVIEEVVESISTFKDVAKSLGVKSETVRLIDQQLNETWRKNRALCQPAV